MGILCLSLCIAGHFSSGFSCCLFFPFLSPCYFTISINTYYYWPTDNRKKPLLPCFRVLSQKYLAIFLISKKDQLANICRGRFPLGWVSSTSSSIIDKSVWSPHLTFVNGNYHLLRAFLVSDTLHLIQTSH